MIAYIKYSVDANWILIDQQPAHNKMLNAEVNIQLDEKVVTGRVKWQVLGTEGKIVGRYYANLIMSSMIYEVEFPGVQVRDYAANATARNVLSQVDEE